MRFILGWTFLWLAGGPLPAFAQIPTPLPPGAAVWLKCEGNIQDATVNLVGIPQNGADFAPGIVGQATRLDGIDGHIVFPNPLTLDLQNALTIEE
jgi:hypothetical protein